MPKVSVIIPTYNRSGLLREAIASVLKQSFEELEVIIVDDGSTDDTRTVVESIDDCKVKYFYKSNGGAPSARNLGLRKSRGEFIAFLESDDQWPEDFLQIIVRHLENNKDYGAAYSSIVVVSSGGQKVKSHCCKSGWLTIDMFRKGFVWPSASVFRKSVWKDLWWDESLNKSYDDCDVFLRLSTRTRFLYVPDTKAFYAQSPDSISATAGNNCTKILILERFYFRLGGDKIVPAKTAKRKISHVCRKVAEARRRTQSRSAAITLYKRAIRYWPLDLRLYLGLGRTLLLNKKNDPNPSRQMPEPLGEPTAHDYNKAQTTGSE
ncbi:glycosyltransferase family 2 protein [bacterium]|nr:glycosyltransferase family 2 protein [bacterium]